MLQSEVHRLALGPETKTVHHSRTVIVVDVNVNVGACPTPLPGTRNLAYARHVPDDSRSFLEFVRAVSADGTLDRKERIEVLQRLIPDVDRGAVTRFSVLLALSVTIAVMGLATNSAAVVIGAMLVAPLMTPIMAFSGAVGLGLARRAIRAGIMVAAGSVGSVLLSIILARFLPDIVLGSEILGRTSPDIRDLIVAVAAGAAGAYAIARPEISAALPGVAVAVALVPPLATTGILIETGNYVLAEGSGLLFLTNLFAIALVALITLFATGVIPTVKLVLRDRRMAATIIGIVIATVVIAVPLTSRSIDAVNSSRQQNDVMAEVDLWLGQRDLEVTQLEIIGTRVTVEVTGLDEPPDAYALATRLVPLLGMDTEVTVRWDARAQGTASAGTPPAADPVDVATDVLQNWVDQTAAVGILLELLEVSVADGRVDAVVTGPVAPPASPGLPDLVAQALGAEVTLSVRWIQSFDPTLASEAPGVRIDRIVNAWIGARTSVRTVATDVTGSDLNGWNVLVDLATDGTPLGLGTLHDTLRTALPGTVTVTVRTLPLEVVDADTAPEPVPVDILR